MKYINGIKRANCIIINTSSLSYKVLEKIEKLLDKNKANYKLIYRKQDELKQTQNMKSKVENI